MLPLIISPTATIFKHGKFLYKRLSRRTNIGMAATGIKDQLPSFGNGVYINSGSSAFLTNTFNKANYFVDVVFVNTLVVPA